MELFRLQQQCIRRLTDEDSGEMEAASDESAAALAGFRLEQDVLSTLDWSAYDHLYCLPEQPEAV